MDMWDELLSVERRFDELFRNVFGTRAHAAAPALPGGRGLHRPFAPAADVFARNGDLVVDLELPGIEPDKDIKVTVEDGKLVVRGERKHAEEVSEENYYRIESSYGAFERRFPIPKGIGESDIEASYKGGVLELVLHGATKVQEEATKQAAEIPIRTTDAS